MVERLVAAGRVTDLDGFLADVAARESQMPTGLVGGIGIPHARSAFVKEPSLAFGRCAGGVDFGAEDGPATLVFLIAAPDGEGAEHMKILASHPRPSGMGRTGAPRAARGCPAGARRLPRRAPRRGGPARRCRPGG
ncbi:PTS sugar transporter subunit IIA [Paraconexibacter antarcticus]|uniref:PTS sugar transporter subunit IIA n=1 Tax=Paraconexibacter antarcticus TaxID=2949664 RepID=UPI003F580E1D